MTEQNITAEAENKQNNAQQQQEAQGAEDNKSLLDEGKEKAGRSKSLLDNASEEAKQAEIKDLKDKIEKSTDEAEKKALQEKLNALEKPITKPAEVVVPEKYEFKSPEGMEIDKDFLEKATPVLKELKISQEGAQKLVDLYTSKLKSVEDAQKANFEKFVNESRDETIKALGPKHKEELAFAAKVRDRFFSTESIEFINASGLGNNKSFIMDLIKMGKLISEDVFVEGEKKDTDTRSPAEKLYPSMKKQH